MKRSHASGQHLYQTNGNFRNKWSAGPAARTVGTDQQNADCPSDNRAAWGEDNESFVLLCSGCGLSEPAGIIWILYDSMFPTLTLHQRAHMETDYMIHMEAELRSKTHRLKDRMDIFSTQFDHFLKIKSQIHIYFSAEWRHVLQTRLSNSHQTKAAICMK